MGTAAVKETSVQCSQAVVNSDHEQLYLHSDDGGIFDPLLQSVVIQSIVVLPRAEDHSSYSKEITWLTFIPQLSYDLPKVGFEPRHAMAS